MSAEIAKALALEHYGLMSLWHNVSITEIQHQSFRLNDFSSLHLRWVRYPLWEL